MVLLQFGFNLLLFYFSIFLPTRDCFSVILCWILEKTHKTLLLVDVSAIATLIYRLTFKQK